MLIPVTGEEIIKATEYEVLGKLPNPFIFDDGTEVKSVEDWEKRRKEIYKYAVELQYGVQPPKPEVLEYEYLTEVEKDLDCIKIYAGTKEKQVSFLMNIYKPAKYDGKYPVIICGDGCWKYNLNPDYMSAMLDNGVGFVQFNRLELAHDIRKEGRHKGALYKVYPDIDFGAISAWAWGYSRCVDVLEQLPFIDTSCITFTGHSRGAKTAMLAGVLDERAHIVNPNETNQGSCSCYRIHMKQICEDGAERRSETLKDLGTNFPFWIGSGMQEYKEREADLPFDAHYLKALVAPRTLCVWEAASDAWTNTIGSWQTTMAANEVFKLYGKEENLIWYYRTGTHAQKPLDIQQLVKVIKHKMNGTPLDDTYYKVPFKKPELIFDWKCPENK
ncbi:MAG: hypothetical protein J6Q76_09465 [Clostridia bacterium]|nr:hypothetical protein [Clostridia bacterium]